MKTKNQISAFAAPLNKAKKISICVSLIQNLMAFHPSTVGLCTVSMDKTNSRIDICDENATTGAFYHAAELQQIAEACGLSHYVAIIDGLVTLTIF